MVWLAFRFLSQVLGQEIIDLQNKNARVRSQEGDLEKTIRTRRDERGQGEFQCPLPS